MPRAKGRRRRNRAFGIVMVRGGRFRPSWSRKAAAPSWRSTHGTATTDLASVNPRWRSRKASTTFPFSTGSMLHVEYTSRPPGATRLAAAASIAALLARVLREVGLLEPPLDVDPVAHDARVRARHVDQDRRVFGGKAVLPEDGGRAVQQVRLDERRLDLAGPRKVLLQPVDPRGRQVHGDQPAGAQRIDDEQALAAGRGAEVEHGLARPSAPRRSTASRVPGSWR